MINRDDWLTAVKEAESAEIPESDAVTMMELANMIGLDRNGAARRIRILLAKGQAEQTTKMIRRTDGRVITVTAFRLLKP